MSHEVNLVILVGSCLLLVAVLAVRVAASTALPTLLVYLAVGLAAGEAGLGIAFEDYRIAADVGLFALAVILADGGLTTRWTDVRQSLPFAAVLSTVGVGVSVGVVAGVALLTLDVDVRTALILAAAVSSTDAAAVFTVLRKLPLPSRVRSALEAESGLNDAPVVALVLLAATDAWERATPLQVVAVVSYQLAVGTAVGLALGVLGAWLLRRTALPAAGLYPLATLALTLLAYASATELYASGFLATYLCGLVLGNRGLPHRTAVLGFSGSVSQFAEVALFLLLGLLASPSRLPEALPAALLIGAAGTLLGRPLAVALSAAPFRRPWREQVFLSWAGLRGAVPIVVAVVPVNERLPGAEGVLDIVFVLVIVYTLLQAPTLPFLARRLGIAQPLATADLLVETAPLDTAGVDVLQLTVLPDSRLRGVYVQELRLPGSARVALVLRDHVPTVPDSTTVLRTGDQVLVVAPHADADAARARLAAVAAEGRLAGWYRQPPPPPSGPPPRDRQDARARVRPVRDLLRRARR